MLMGVGDAKTAAPPETLSTKSLTSIFPAPLQLLYTLESNVTAIVVLLGAKLFELEITGGV